LCLKSNRIFLGQTLTTDNPQNTQLEAGRMGIFMTHFSPLANPYLPFTEKFINLALLIRFCRSKKLILTLDLLLPCLKNYQKVISNHY
jgi:hypothetical protein